MSDPTDPRPQTTPARYRKIARDVARLAEYEKLLQTPTVKIADRHIDLPSDVIAEVEQRYAATVRQLKDRVNALEESYQGNSANGDLD